MNTTTALEVCIKYAKANLEVKVLTATLKASTCTNEQPGDGISRNPAASISCLARYFDAGRSYDENGIVFSPDTPTLQESLLQEMCPGCRLRLVAIEDRKAAKKALSSCLRAITRMGKKALAVA